MGLAGPNRKTIKRASAGRLRPSSGPHPWEKPGLSRAAKVMAFIESSAGKSRARSPVPCSSCAHGSAGFIRAVYATDKRAGASCARLCCRMGRGNGKTTLAAMLGLCHLAGPES